MAEFLRAWVNNHQLSSNVESFERQFSNGYLIAELLAKRKVISEEDFADFRNQSNARSKIENFKRLEPVLRDLGCHFDTNLIGLIMMEQRGATAQLIYEVRCKLEPDTAPNPKRFANPDANFMEPMRRPKAQVTADPRLELAVRGKLNGGQIDLACHLAKYSEEQQRQERAAFQLEAKEVEEIRVARAERRQQMVEESRQRTAFVNEWLESSKVGWRKNQRVKANRERKELTYELAMRERRRVRSNNERFNKMEEMRWGVEDFERNLKRLGMGGDDDNDSGAPLDPAADVDDDEVPRERRIQRLDRRALLETVNSSIGKGKAADAAYVAQLTEKRISDFKARRDREARRCKMLVDQQRTQDEVTRKREIDTILERVRQESRAEREETASQRARKHAKQREREHAVEAAAIASKVLHADAARRFADWRTQYRIEFSKGKAARTQKLMEWHAAREAKDDAKHQFAVEVASSTAELLCELALAVSLRREKAREVARQSASSTSAAALMPAVEWRRMREIFVAGGPFPGVASEEEEPVLHVTTALLDLADFKDYCECHGAWAAGATLGISPVSSTLTEITSALATLSDVHNGILDPHGLAPLPSPSVNHSEGTHGFGIVVIGGVLSGRTSVANIIALHFGLRLISPAAVVTEAFRLHEERLLMNPLKDENEEEIPLAPKGKKGGKSSPTSSRSSSSPEPSMDLDDEGVLLKLLGEEVAQAVARFNKSRSDESVEGKESKREESKREEPALEEAERPGASADSTVVPWLAFRDTESIFLMRLIAQRIKRAGSECGGWVLDGVPTSITQARALEFLLRGPIWTADEEIGYGGLGDGTSLDDFLESAASGAWAPPRAPTDGLVTENESKQDGGGKETGVSESCSPRARTCAHAVLELLPHAAPVLPEANNESVPAEGKNMEDTKSNEAFTLIEVSESGLAPEQYAHTAAKGMLCSPSAVNYHPARHVHAKLDDDVLESMMQYPDVENAVHAWDEERPAIRQFYTELGALRLIVPTLTEDSCNDDSSFTLQRSGLLNAAIECVRVAANNAEAFCTNTCEAAVAAAEAALEEANVRLLAKEGNEDVNVDESGADSESGATVEYLKSAVIEANAAATNHLMSVRRREEFAEPRGVVLWRQHSLATHPSGWGEPVNLEAAVALFRRWGALSQDFGSSACAALRSARDLVGGASGYMSELRVLRREALSLLRGRFPDGTKLQTDSVGRVIGAKDLPEAKRRRLTQWQHEELRNLLPSSLPDEFDTDGDGKISYRENKLARNFDASGVSSLLTSEVLDSLRDLEEDLWDQAEAHATIVKKEFSSWAASGAYRERWVTEITGPFIALADAEAVRYNATRNLIKDFFASVDPSLLSTGFLPTTTETKSKAESSSFRRPSNTFDVVALNLPSGCALVERVSTLISMLSKRRIRGEDSSFTTADGDLGRATLAGENDVLECRVRAVAHAASVAVAAVRSAVDESFETLEQWLTTRVHAEDNNIKELARDARTCAEAEWAASLRWLASAPEGTNIPLGPRPSVSHDLVLSEADQLETDRHDGLSVLDTRNGLLALTPRVLLALVEALRDASLAILGATPTASGSDSLVTYSVLLEALRRCNGSTLPVAWDNLCRSGSSGKLIRLIKAAARQPEQLGATFGVHSDQQQPPQPQTFTRIGCVGSPKDSEISCALGDLVFSVLCGAIPRLPTVEELLQLRDAYEAADSDSDGCLTYPEFTSVSLWFGDVKNDDSGQSEVSVERQIIEVFWSAWASTDGLLAYESLLLHLCSCNHQGGFPPDNSLRLIGLHKSFSVCAYEQCTAPLSVALPAGSDAGAGSEALNQATLERVLAKGLGNRDMAKTLSENVFDGLGRQSEDLVSFVEFSESAAWRRVWLSGTIATPFLLADVFSIWRGDDVVV